MVSKERPCAQVTKHSVRCSLGVRFSLIVVVLNETVAGLDFFSDCIVAALFVLYTDSFVASM